MQHYEFYFQQKKKKTNNYIPKNHILEIKIIITNKT
jgi:hypothetical protein